MNEVTTHLDATDPCLKYETEIVWLQPLDTLPRYVREYVNDFCKRRQRKPRLDSCPRRMVGYAVLSKDAPSRQHGIFTRRCFWLADHDPYKGGGAPCEGVDPLTVKPGQPGQRNDRVNGETKGDAQ